jgi:hypothetical protein
MSTQNKSKSSINNNYETKNTDIKSSPSPDPNIQSKTYESNLSKDTAVLNNSNSSLVTSKDLLPVLNNKKCYTISEFVLPEGFELHIKIWKDGKETEEYYLYTPGEGINANSITKRYPLVDALCCIKYGKTGDLKPFYIDLNMYGKGMTDLPGCEVNNTQHPNNSLSVNLPTEIPNTNL